MIHSSIFLYISKRCNFWEKKFEHCRNDFTLIEYHQHLCYNCAPFLERKSFITKLLHQNWMHKKSISQSHDRKERSKTKCNKKSWLPLGELSIELEIGSSTREIRKKVERKRKKRKKAEERREK